MYFPNALRRARRHSTIPSSRRVARSSSRGCPSRVRIAARLIGSRHIGQVKAKVPSGSRSPPSTPRRTSGPALRDHRQRGQADGSEAVGAMLSGCLRLGVRRGKALYPSGCESRPATVAPAGSSRSGARRQRIAGDAKGGDGRRDVAVVDLRRANLLGSLARFLLIGAPGGRALEHLHLSQHAQGVDAAARAPAGRLVLRPAGAPISHQFLDRRVDPHDFRHQRPRELGPETAAGFMPGRWCLQATEQTGRRLTSAAFRPFNGPWKVEEPAGHTNRRAPIRPLCGSPAWESDEIFSVAHPTSLWVTCKAGHRPFQGGGAYAQRSRIHPS